MIRRPPWTHQTRLNPPSNPRTEAIFNAASVNATITEPTISFVMSDLIHVKSPTSAMSATRGLRDRQLPRTFLEFQSCHGLLTDTVSHPVTY